MRDPQALSASVNNTLETRGARVSFRPSFYGPIHQKFCPDLTLATQKGCRLRDSQKSFRTCGQTRLKLRVQGPKYKLQAFISRVIPAAGRLISNYLPDIFDVRGKRVRNTLGRDFYLHSLIRECGVHKSEDIV
jgi:hypothetical protein